MSNPETPENDEVALPANLVPLGRTAPGALDLDVAFAVVESQVAAGGWRARWTEIPTPGRIAMGAALVVGVAGAFLFRVPDGVVLGGRFAVTAVALLGMTIVALSASLRPMQLAPLPGWTSTLVTLGAAVIAAMVAVLPATGDIGITNPHFFSSAGMCFAEGGAFGIVLLGAWKLLSRAGIRSIEGLAAAAAAAGLGGNLVLATACHIDDPGHVLLAHAGVVFSFVVAGMFCNLLLSPPE